MFTSHLSTVPPSGLDLWRPSRCCRGLCELLWVSALLCLDGLVSLEVSIPSDSYSLAASSSTMFLEPGGDWMCQGLSLSVHLSVSICNRREFLWWWLSKTLMYEPNRMSFEIIVLLCSFSGTVVFGFPLGLCPTQSQVLGHLSSIRHGFALTFVPAYHAGRMPL